jgi:hypothetical protein
MEIHVAMFAAAGMLLAALLMRWAYRSAQAAMEIPPVSAFWLAERRRMREDSGF